MHVGQEAWPKETPVHVGAIVMRLRMVAVNLMNAGGRQIVADERLGVDGGEANVGEAALVGAAGRIAQYEGEDIDAEVVVSPTPDGAADEEVAVAAAEIDDEWGTAAEEGDDIKWRGGELLEGGLGPMRGLQDFPSDRNAMFTLDSPRLFHRFAFLL